MYTLIFKLHGGQAGARSQHILTGRGISTQPRTWSGLVPGTVLAVVVCLHIGTCTGVLRGLWNSNVANGGSFPAATRY